MSTSVVGAYTTTGDKDPEKNTRIQTCLWSLDHRDRINLSITKIAQMTPETLFTKCPRIKQIVRQFVHPQDQLCNKFILSIKGNTETWDQSWVMSSNSLMLKLYHDEMCWYGPLLRDKEHLIVCHNNEDILKKSMEYSVNIKDAERIVSNAHSFVNNFLVPSDHAIQYWAFLLEESALNKK